MRGLNQRDPEALLPEQAAAEFLSLSARTLQGWRLRGCGPTFVRAGRAIRYRRSDLSAWVDANVVTISAASDQKRAGR